MRSNATRQEEGIPRPWEVRRDWAAGRVRANGPRELAGVLVVGSGAAALCSLLVYQLIDQGGPVALWCLMGFFLLMPTFLFLRAGVLALRCIVHGRPVLYLDDPPVRPGRDAAVGVRTARALPAPDWEIWLRCVLDASTQHHLDPSPVTRWAEQNDGRPPKPLGIWQGRCIYDRKLSPAGRTRTSQDGCLLMPVIVRVPADAPETPRLGQPGVRWLLVVRARAWPVSFVADFDLPVFRTYESRATPAAE